MDSLLFGTAGVPPSSPKPDSLAGIARLRELGPAGLEDMHIHLSGIEYGPGGEREHVMLDEADMRYVEVLQALKDFRVKGLLICESPDKEIDALILQEAYRQLEESKGQGTRGARDKENKG